MGNRFKFEIKKNNLVSIKRKKRVDKRGYFEKIRKIGYFKESAKT